MLPGSHGCWPSCWAELGSVCHCLISHMWLLLCCIHPFIRKYTKVNLVHANDSGSHLAHGVFQPSVLTHGVFVFPPGPSESSLSARENLAPPTPLASAQRWCTCEECPPRPGGKSPGAQCLCTAPLALRSPLRTFSGVA